MALMILGLVAITVRDSVTLHRQWLFLAYLIMFTGGLIVNWIGWREQGRQGKTP
jgi:protein-S-isoprenylcysteine O-methyltransferase Ste14